jgi:hypothetical protein
MKPDDIPAVGSMPVFLLKKLVAFFVSEQNERIFGFINVESLISC